MYPSLNTTSAIAAHLDGVQLITHIGDISYARGWVVLVHIALCLTDCRYVSQWEYFHNQVEPISAAVPWMTAIGNHGMVVAFRCHCDLDAERDWPGSGSVRGLDDSGGECGIAYGRLACGLH